MKEISKNIKEKQFYKVYLLTGDEGYLILQAKQMLKNALVNEGDEMNYTAYEEAKVDLAAVRDLAATFPFFSEKRVILLNQTNVMKTGKDELVNVFENLPETTCLIICDSEVDKRSKAYKWIKKNGYIGEFLKKNQKEQTLVTFLARILAKEKKQIREDDAKYFISLVGDELFQIKNEAEKLICYLGEENVVTREAIDAIVTQQVQDKIFDMVTALAQKNQTKALAYYNDLILLKEPPMHILYLIVRQYRILVIMKSMRAQRKADADIAKCAGVPPFSLRRYDGQLRIYDLLQLEDCLKKAIKLEEEIKTGKIGDQIGLEMLLIQLSE